MAEAKTKKKRVKKAVKKVSGKVVSSKKKKAGVSKNSENSRDFRKEVTGRGSGAESPKRFFRSNKRKIKLVAMNLTLFSACFLFSLMVYFNSWGAVKNVFKFLSIISGAVTGAFVLVFLILVFMRFFRETDETTQKST